MSPFYRDKLKESSQLFAAILVFGVLGKWNFLPTDYWGGELVKIILDVAIAILVVFLVCDIIFGKPTLHLEWRKGSRDRPLSGEVLIEGKKQVLNLQLQVSGGTALQQYLLKRSLDGALKVEVRLLPEGHVRLTRQGGTPHFRCSDDRRTLIFDRVEMDTDRSVGTADFTLKRLGNSDFTQEVTVQTSACWEPKIWHLPVKLTKLESAVDRFVLEGHQ